MKVLCEISVRHVHLSENDFVALYGKGAKLDVVRDLSQPGQFLSAQKVDLVGPKRVIEGVSILGPFREQSQVEISRTDCFTLGIKDVCVRQSGKLDGTPGVTLRHGDKTVALSSGVIIAQRHVHIDPKTAEQHGFTDNEIVDLVFDGERGGVLHNAVLRVHKNFANSAHVDSDEGNALACGNLVEIKKR